jgi:GTP-binding protein HflX
VARPLRVALGEAPLEELAALTETAGGVVVATLVQKLPKPHAATYLGRGKLNELKTLVRRHKAQAVIFDNELSPAQLKRIEDTIDCHVMDRSELILAIFAARARSRQARIQVELAQLEYTLPRLRRMWTHLERQVGGIGVRGGPGERQLEVDRRRMRRRIGDLQKKLGEIARRTERRVRARQDTFNASLVGYTNGGKSTLLNALTGADTFVEDRLFATLDTKTRILRLDGGKRALLSDTVGFIRRLPHHLIASFHATLEETLRANLLLHVVDVSHPAHEAQIEGVDEVLRSIGADKVPAMMVFNKTDALDSAGRAGLRLLMERYPGSLALSAKTGDGLDQLRHEILAASSRGAQKVTLRVPADDGAALVYLDRHAFVLKRTCLDSAVTMDVLIHAGHLEKLRGQHAGVEVVGK